MLLEPKNIESLEQFGFKQRKKHIGRDQGGFIELKVNSEKISSVFFCF